MSDNVLTRITRAARFAAASGFVLVSGCQTITARTSLSTPLQGSEFNSVSSHYLPRPTEVELIDTKEGGPALLVKMHQYAEGIAVSDPANLGPNSMAFQAGHADEYLAVFDKYDEWTKLAQERGDIIDRPLGMVKGGAASGTGQLKFTFVSGNASNHLLLAEFCLVACVSPIYFTRDNVAILRRLITDLKSGRLKQLDADAVYK